MKKLSDYKDEEAIEIWGDLLEPMTKILADPVIANAMRAHKAPLMIAKDVMKNHKDEAKEIILRIDPTPIDGINFAARVASIVMDFLNNDALKDFFVSAGQAKMEKEPTGSATENTEAVEA